MWTTDNRAKYDRDKLRYPSDLTDAEWALVEPLIPPAKHGGRDREVDLREVVNGIMYVLSTGCQWRYIPKDLPPKSTLHDYLVRWNDDHTLTAIHYALFLQCREMMQREPSPSACIIDSQSVKSTEKGGRNVDPNGYDAGKKIKGKKRRVSRTHRQGKEVWCCMRDEGGPLEVGSQVQASNRCKLRTSRAAVVSVAEKPRLDFGRYDLERRARANRR